MSAADARRFRALYALWLFSLCAYFVPAATWNPVSRINLTRAIVELHTLSVDPFATDSGDRARYGDHWYSDKAPIPALLAVPVYAAAVGWRARTPPPRPLEPTAAPSPVPAASSAQPGEPVAEPTPAGSADPVAVPAPAASADPVAVAPTPAPLPPAAPAPGPDGPRLLIDARFVRGLYACSVSTAGIAAAVLGVLLFEVLRRKTTAQAALLASAATVLGTPIFPYGTSFYGHTIAAAFLFGAFAAVVLSAGVGEPSEAEPPAPTRASVRIAGACLVLAGGCEYIVFVPATVLGAWIVWRQARGSRTAALIDLAIGGLAPALVLAGYHTACFGAPWRTAYSYIDTPQFAAGHASGLLGIHLPRLDAILGLLVGPKRGLFYLAPIALAAVVGGAVYQHRTRDPWGAGPALASLALLVLNAGYYMWWGGAATGPRHLVPVLGFLGLGIAAAWSDRRARRLVAVLVVVSIANMVVLTAVGLEVPEGYRDSLLEYAWPLLAEGKIAYLPGASNLGIRLGIARAGALGPWIALMLFGFRHLWSQLAPPPPPVATPLADADAESAPDEAGSV